jgi:hypothetical protein
MGESRLVEEVRTRASQEVAFGYTADFDHQAEWDPNTTASRRITPPPIGVGSRFALDVRMGARSLPMEYRITTLDAPERVVLVGEGPGIWTEDDISFRADGAGTLVRYAARIRLGGILGLVQPLLGGPMRRLGRDAAAGLRRELDRRADEGR